MIWRHPHTEDAETRAVRATLSRRRYLLVAFLLGAAILVIGRDRLVLVKCSGGRP